MKTLALALSLLLMACSTTPESFEAVSIPIGATPSPAKSNPDKSLQRIAFGSCNKQYLPQPLWKNIIADKPDLFIWTGDVVYGDTEDMAKLSQIYLSQLRQAEYANFLASGTPVIGVYDDHDYGKNNGGKEFAAKKGAQQLFLDFIGEPADSERRLQDGIYAAYSFGPPGQQVKVILLDTRYNRDQPGPEGDLLGSTQWAWLEKELASGSPQLTLLVSSIEVLPYEHDFEKWANFPRSRERLLKLLESYKNVVLLSGDRHLAQLSRHSYSSGGELWEVTSSGLTHSYQNHDAKRNKNSLRVAPVYDRLNYGLLTLDWKQRKLQLELRNLNRTSVISQQINLGK